MFHSADTVTDRLFSVIERKDAWTAAHCRRVARLMAGFTEWLGEPPEAVGLAFTIGLLHDIGKIESSPELLAKIARGESFTPGEKQAIRSHVTAAAAALREHPQADRILPAALHHHEHFDGTGYPDGLIGDDIPETARILAVADHFDAIGAVRPGRPAMSHEDIAARLTSLAGTRLDPRIVDRFLKWISEGNIIKPES